MRFTHLSLRPRNPAPASSFEKQWSPKTKADLLNLKSTEEALDWLIKDCAQQLFALTDLKDNAEYPLIFQTVCDIICLTIIIVLLSVVMVLTAVVPQLM